MHSIHLYNFSSEQVQYLVFSCSPLRVGISYSQCTRVEEMVVCDCALSMPGAGVEQSVCVIASCTIRVTPACMTPSHTQSSVFY